MSSTLTPSAAETAGRYTDPVIQAYKKNVDRELIRAMLRLTPEQRLERLQSALEDAAAREQAAPPPPLMVAPAYRDAAPGATGDGRCADPVIEAYKKDVDRTLIRHNLRLTVQERFEGLMALQEFAAEMRAAMLRATAGKQ